jgi:hypothetical protein
VSRLRKAVIRLNRYRVDLSNVVHIQFRWNLESAYRSNGSRDYWRSSKGPLLELDYLPLNITADVTDGFCKRTDYLVIHGLHLQKKLDSS